MLCPRLSVSGNSVLALGMKSTVMRSPTPMLGDGGYRGSQAACDNSDLEVLSTRNVFLTLSSLASISTTSVSTSSIAAL